MSPATLLGARGVARLTSTNPVRTFLRLAGRRTHLAQVAELVDALVSGTSGAIRGGSSPLLGTNPDMIVGAQLLPAHAPYAGGGQELLVGDPHQIAALILGDIERGIRACDELVQRTHLAITRREPGAHADTQSRA
jgi:hypothetical protein